MKKIIMAMLLCILLVGCVNDKPYTEIKYKEFVKKIEEKESFIFYIGSSQCVHCDRYEKALKRVVKKHNVKVYYLDTASENMTKEERKGLDDQVNFSGTPTTVFVKDGEVQSRYNRIDGAASTDKIIEAFIRNGYINKE